MKNTLYFAVALCMMYVSVSALDYLPNRIIVKFKEAGHALILSSKKNSVLCTTLPAVEQLNIRYKCNGVEELSGRRNAETKPRMYALNFPAGTNMKQLIEEYQKIGVFEFVERDAYGEGTGRRVLRSTKKSQKKRADVQIIPDDPKFVTQWSLRNTGTFSLAPSKSGADIKMTDAWTQTQGDSSIIVAILDSGCDVDHPEFAGRTWLNKQEIPGNGTDDDGNGFADDVNGWNFAYTNASINDDHGHGTNVASIIGMNGNNGRGLAGMDWRCKLMNLKVLDSNNRGLYSWWAAAVSYASDNGARVINMSLGGTTPSNALQSAIAEAVANNSIVIVSMGNDNSENPSYPAATAGAMAVGCTNPNDTRTTSFPWNSAKGSNYGSHISVCAPGNFIYGLDNTNRTSYTSYWSGTSQAAPHVSGLCALLLAQNPSLSPAQLRKQIEQSADDQIGNPIEDVKGWDKYYGFGRINAARALGVQTSIDESREVAELEILSANPTTGVVRFAVRGLSDKPYIYTITSLSGTLIQQGTAEADNILTFGSYAQGVYYLCVTPLGKSQQRCIPLVVEK